MSGIELDIQLTSDGELVVIHDERVDRTTNGIGFVREHTFVELRKLRIDAGNNDSTQLVPAMEEVLDLLEKQLRTGLKLNIELKTASIRIKNMEEKIVELVHKRGLQEAVVYSTFMQNHSQC